MDHAHRRGLGTGLASCFEIGLMYCCQTLECLVASEADVTNVIFVCDFLRGLRLAFWCFWFCHPQECGQVFHLARCLGLDVTLLIVRRFTNDQLMIFLWLLL